MYLDLAEIDQVLSLSRLWSRKKASPARFNRADYFQFVNPAPQEDQSPAAYSVASTAEENPSLPGDINDLDLAVRNAVNHSLNFYPVGPIRLLTNLRYFGYCINPISCYYCFSGDDDSDTEQLQAILIEVTNTPWGEKTHYVLDLRNYSPRDQIDFKKLMHVSPFMAMDMDYQWSGKVPGALLQYSLTNIPHGLSADVPTQRKIMFAAGVNFKRTEITRKSLNKIIYRYPFMTLKVALGIYWQALRLTLKKVSFVPHPNSGIKVGKHDPN